MDVGAHRAGDLAHRDVLFGPPQPFDIAFDLLVPEEELNAKGNAGVGLVLDMYGSIAVDQVAYKTREIIQQSVLDKGYQAMIHGYCIGKNCRAYTDCGGVIAYWLAPGYSDLKTSEQKNIFTLLDGSQIGVHLSESCMMTPRKSYSCLLPIGPQEEKASNPCQEGDKDWVIQGSIMGSKAMH